MGGRWYDATIEGISPGYGYYVRALSVDPHRVISLRRHWLIPLVNAPEWRIEFQIGSLF